MRKDIRNRRKHIRLLFVLRQERGVYLSDIPFKNLTDNEKDKIRRDARKWAMKNKD